MKVGGDVLQQGVLLEKARSEIGPLHEPLCVDVQHPRQLGVLVAHAVGVLLYPTQGVLHLSTGDDTDAHGRKSG